MAASALPRVGVLAGSEYELTLEAVDPQLRDLLADRAQVLTEVGSRGGGGRREANHWDGYTQ